MSNSSRCASASDKRARAWASLVPVEPRSGARLARLICPLLVRGAEIIGLPARFLRIPPLLSD